MGIRIGIASERERRAIYRMRHAVYAAELRQHATRPDRVLTDAVDASNRYLVATVDGRVIGFVSITPPSAPNFSIEKYLSDGERPFERGPSVYEVRLLTVAGAYRRRSLAALLMYAAFRWIEEQGGTRIVAMGRQEVLDLYLKLGLRPLGRTIQSGDVTFELLAAALDELRRYLIRYAPLLERARQGVEWGIGVPFTRAPACYHGGAFWEAIGDTFDTLHRRDCVINADVLDAWYPPAPGVIDALREHLPWLIRTSPPTGGEGLIHAIASARGVAPDRIVPGAGSSSLIFLAFRLWLRPSSRVLLLDPTYGEYAHVLEQVVRCRVDRLSVSRREGYRLDPARLTGKAMGRYDLIVLVNPNSPTGQHVPSAELQAVLRGIPETTTVWVDETYSDYVRTRASLERFAARRRNIVICKSMSKVYALSGLRVAYLVAPPDVAAVLRSISPPWAVSLPAQVAAIAALRAPKYYAQRYRETHALRIKLIDDLSQLCDIDIISGAANFILCHLSPEGRSAAEVCHLCRQHGLFLRDASSMSPSLGTHALRIAVKDAASNQQMVEVLTRVLSTLNGTKSPTSRERMKS